MKTRAELADDVCAKACDLVRNKYNPYAMDRLIQAAILWRNAPTDPPDPKSTPDPMILSDKLSDGEVWLNAFHAVKCERARISQEEYADTCLNTFKRRFRKEPK